MGNPNLAFGGSLGFGVESTWGTAVSRTNWLHALELGLEHTPEWNDREHMGFAGAASLTRRADPYISAEQAGGSIVVPASYNDSTALLLEHWIGSVATTGSGPYTHTYKMVDPENMPVGLTIEQILGMGVLDDTEVYEGCMVAGGRLSISVGQPARLALDIIGERGAGYTSAGTPSYNSAPAPVLYDHAGNLAWSSLADKIVSLECVLDHGLGRRQLMGTRYTQKPKPTTRPTVEWNITREWDENTVRSAYLAGTAGDATITFTGSGNNSLALTLHNARCVRVSNPVSGEGVIQQTFTLRGYADGTDRGFKAVLVNDNATAATN